MSTTKSYQGRPFSADDPGMSHFEITKSDSENYTECRAIYVGGTGDVSLVDPFGNAVTYVSVPAGSVIEVCSIRVNSTGTTATSLVGII